MQQYVYSKKSLSLRFFYERLVKVNKKITNLYFKARISFLYNIYVQDSSMTNAFITKHTFRKSSVAAPIFVCVCVLETSK
jgi:hypothetical protein